MSEYSGLFIFCMGVLSYNLFVIVLKLLKLVWIKINETRAHQDYIIQSDYIQRRIDKREDLFSITGKLTQRAEEILIENGYDFKYINREKKRLLIWRDEVKL